MFNIIVKVHVSSTNDFHTFKESLTNTMLVKLENRSSEELTENLIYTILQPVFLFLPFIICLFSYKLFTCTFQWTVNGVLRVGFFTKKEIPADTELTFDYQFETYG